MNEVTFILVNLVRANTATDTEVRDKTTSGLRNTANYFYPPGN